MIVLCRICAPGQPCALTAWRPRTSSSSALPEERDFFLLGRPASVDSLSKSAFARSFSLRSSSGVRTDLPPRGNSSFPFAGSSGRSRFCGAITTQSVSQRRSAYTAGASFRIKYRKRAKPMSCSWNGAQLKLTTEERVGVPTTWERSSSVTNTGIAVA